MIKIENKYFYGSLVAIVLVVVIAAVAMFTLNSTSEEYSGNFVAGTGNLSIASTGYD